MKVFSILMLIVVSSNLSAAETHDVSLQLEGVELHGTLLMPEGAFEMVILHAGSGPTDRDGNQPGMSNNSLKLLAEGLAGHGLAVLRYDKRGVGASRNEAGEDSMRPGLYIADLVAWADWALAQPGIGQVHLLGHSEGALFAKAAAIDSQVGSVISLAGAGRQAGKLLLEQTEGRRPGQIGEQFEFILGELEAGRPVDEVPPVLNALFRPSVQPYLIEWLEMDPARIAAALDSPLLVIGGSTDLQVGKADFEALSAHADQAAWIEGMNHVLKAAEGPIEQQLPIYMDPKQPLHEELVGTIAEFIRGRLVP